MRSQHRDAEARVVLAPLYERFTEGFSMAKVKRVAVV